MHNGEKEFKDPLLAVLVMLNILACVYPIGSDDDATRLFAVLVLMGGFILLAVADTLSIVFAHWL